MRQLVCAVIGVRRSYSWSWLSLLSLVSQLETAAPTPPARYVIHSFTIPHFLFLLHFALFKTPRILHYITTLPFRSFPSDPTR